MFTWMFIVKRVGRVFANQSDDVLIARQAIATELDVPLEHIRLMQISNVRIPAGIQDYTEMEYRHFCLLHQQVKAGRTEQWYMQVQAHLREVGFGEQYSEEERTFGKSTFPIMQGQYKEDHGTITGTFRYTEEDIRRAKEAGWE